MKKYLYMANYMVKIREDKSSPDYRLINSSRTVRASSFTEARCKVRKSTSYDIVGLKVSIIRETLISKVLRYFRKPKK